MPNDDHVRAMEETYLIDPEVRATANRLALKALRHAEEILDKGNPELKIRVIHSLLPAVAKLIREDEQDDEFAVLKRQMFEMMRQMGLTKELTQAIET